MYQYALMFGDLEMAYKREHVSINKYVVSPKSPVAVVWEAGWLGLGLTKNLGLGSNINERSILEFGSKILECLGGAIEITCYDSWYVWLFIHLIKYGLHHVRGSGGSMLIIISSCPGIYIV